MVTEPSALLLEVMYRRPATPFTASSSGVVTDASTVAASAPRYCAVTVMTGGAIFGYCEIGSVGIATSPAVKITREQTAAKIGRRRKNPIMPPPPGCALSTHHRS